MNKRIIKIFILSIIFSLFSGCFLEVPEKVTIKTNAEYNLGIGSLKFSLSDFIDLDSQIEASADDISNFKIYDYNPGNVKNGVKQFLIKMAIQEIPIDFGSYLSDTNLTDAISDMSFSQEIEVPEVKIEQSEDIDVDGIESVICALSSFSGTTIGGSVVFTNNTFESITYSRGNLVITSLGGNINGTVTLKKGSETIGYGMFINGAARINLTGKSLYYSGMTIEFSDNSQSINYVAAMDSTTKISQATGINIAAVTVPLGFSTDMDLASMGIYGCKVKNGNITVSIKLPNEWTGISSVYGIDLSGAMNLHSDPSADSKQISLNDVVIQDTALGVHSDLVLSVTNGTFDFSKNPKFEIKSQINTLDYVTIEMEDLDTNYSTDAELPTDFREYIKSLVLVSSGITGTYTNTLPEGNDIFVSAFSNFLGLNDNTSLQANSQNKEFSLLSSSSERIVDIKHPTSGFGTYDSIDFDVNFLLPGAVATNPNRMTIRNVEIGAKYSIALNFQCKFDWNKITLYASGSRLSDKINTHITLDSFFDALRDTEGNSILSGITMKTIPIYLYVDKPNLPIFANASFSVDHMKMYMGYQEGNVVTQVPGTTAIDFMNGSTSLSFVNSPKFQYDKGVLITDLSQSSASISNDIVSLVNDSLAGTQSQSDLPDKGLCIDYDLQFSTGTVGEIEINKSDFASLEDGPTSIGVFAYVALPLSFNVASDKNIDILGLMGLTADTDLLGRTGPSTDEEFLEAIEVIQQAAIVYKTSQFPFKTDNPIKIGFNMNGSTNDADYEYLSVDEGVFGINPAQMIRTYPFIPRVKIVLPQGTLSFTRDFAFDMNLSVKLKTNGKLTILGDK